MNVPKCLVPWNIAGPSGAFTTFSCHLLFLLGNIWNRGKIRTRVTLRSASKTTVKSVSAQRTWTSQLSRSAIAFLLCHLLSYVTMMTLKLVIKYPLQKII